MKNKFRVAAIAILCSICLNGLAQVTTSSLSGHVLKEDSQGLENATITLTHEPSGTVYNTLSKSDGVFVIPSARIGGPYTLKVEYVGYKTSIQNEIYLKLGEGFDVNVVMANTASQLTDVMVKSQSKSNNNRTGASTNVSNRQIQIQPTLSRGVSDFTRLAPQANGTSFAGRDPRYNNLQVDGANLNNNFGLSNDLVPGGSSGGSSNNPISIDAIDQVTVNIAPFDVRQSGFTGAGINAVTKSGTNKFHGSAYGLYRDQNFNGSLVGSVPQLNLASQNTIYGFTFGGPIIKNKLFFFANLEKEQRTYAGNLYSPSGGSGLGNVSSTRIDSLAKFSNLLKSKYGYDAGAYDNFPNLTASNYKMLVKLDWNMTPSTKLTLKFSQMESDAGTLVNSTSKPSGLTFTSVARNGFAALSFNNTNYSTRDLVRSAALELNTNVKGQFSNQFIATLTNIRSTRSPFSTPFPFIDILNNTTASTAGNIGSNYMSAGLEPYSNNNDVKNNIYNITDNFTYYLGKHAITAGGSYEFQSVGNQYMPGSQSYYVFSNLNDFVLNKAPVGFTYTYSLDSKNPAVYSAQMYISQLSGYIQDEYVVSNKFKVVAGLRVEAPWYSGQPKENKSISAIPLLDANGKTTYYSTGRYPNQSLYFSPRVGLTYDVNGDKSTIIRGGSGIFTGRIPFVYLTNIPSNSGMYQFTTAISGANNNFLFNPDINYYNPFRAGGVVQTATGAAAADYAKSLPTTLSAAPQSSFVVADRDFKFPSVWRSNLAVERKFDNGWSASIEGLYTQDINAVRYRNANQLNPNASFLQGGLTRYYYSSSNVGVFRKNEIGSTVTNAALVLENITKGYSGSVTAQVAKSFSFGFNANVAYTYTVAQVVTDNPGSQATSTFNGNATSNTQNTIELAPSQYAAPNRVIASLSYKFSKTTVSLFYEGLNQGALGVTRYSYTYLGDLNGDGNNITDLMYIPNNASEINFVTTSGTTNGVTYSYTAQQQSDAFFKFINQDDYLKNHKGEFAKRNGALYPFYSRFDLKIMQELFGNMGSKGKNSLLLSLDVLNVANLINSNWGLKQQINFTNILSVASSATTTNGNPTFKMYVDSKTGKLASSTFTNSTNVFDLWTAQLGLKFIF